MFALVHESGILHFHKYPQGIQNPLLDKSYRASQKMVITSGFEFLTLGGVRKENWKNPTGCPKKMILTLGGMRKENFF